MAIRAARALPIDAGISAEPPPSIARPTRVKASWKNADRSATTRSQASASGQPYPDAAPCTPATTGFGSSEIAAPRRWRG
jgi:hypothetical protein